MDGDPVAILNWRTSKDQAKLDEMADAVLTAVGELAEARTQIDDLLARDNRGWETMSDGGQFWTHAQRIGFARTATVLAAEHPLVKRGLSVREGYVWAGNVQVTLQDDPDAGQDVGAVFRKFWDDPRNRWFTGKQGCLEQERLLGTAGEMWLALPTLNGRVFVRSLAWQQITRILTDPEDEFTDWFYLREYADAAGKQQRVLYPALNFRPAARPAVASKPFLPLDHPGWKDLSGVPIRWDSPVRKVIVNPVGGRGMGDAHASIPWAEGHGLFLKAWQKLMLSLARFAWQVKASKPDKAVEAAGKVLAAAQAAGQTAVTDPATKLEAISKSGATFDAASGQPLLAMVAAGFGIPVTMLSTDPGSTGARAVAETLDQPTENEFGLRRSLHTEIRQDIIGYVIDAAVREGLLKGTVERDADMEIVTLPDDDQRVVEVTWPEFDSVPIKDLIDAISQASGLAVLSDMQIAKLLLAALPVPDIEAALAEITDEDGNYIPYDLREDTVRSRFEDRGGNGD